MQGRHTIGDSEEELEIVEELLVVSSIPVVARSPPVEEHLEARSPPVEVPVSLQPGLLDRLRRQGRDIPEGRMRVRVISKSGRPVDLDRIKLLPITGCRISKLLLKPKEQERTEDIGDASRPKTERPKDQDDLEARQKILLHEISREWMEQEQHEEDVEEKDIGEKSIEEENIGEKNIGEENIGGDNIGDGTIWEENIEKKNILEEHIEEKNIETICEENIGEENIGEETIREKTIRKLIIGKKNLWVEKNIGEEYIEKDNIGAETIGEENIGKKNVVEENVVEERVVEETSGENNNKEETAVENDLVDQTGEDKSEEKNSTEENTRQGHTDEKMLLEATITLFYLGGSAIPGYIEGRTNESQKTVTVETSSSLVVRLGGRRGTGTGGWLEDRREGERKRAARWLEQEQPSLHNATRLWQLTEAQFCSQLGLCSPTEARDLRSRSSLPIAKRLRTRTGEHRRS